MLSGITRSSPLKSTERALDDLQRTQFQDLRSTPRAAQALLRLFEVALAAAMLVLTSPVMLIVAILIRLDSPGPALFRQQRVGQGGRLFWFYKFRTLFADARARFPELYAYEYTLEEIEALQFKTEEDPRVTRVGRWLRRITVDELPNFLNLLKGDITLVGPRAEIPEMIRYYPPEQLVKFSVKPGVTGLAQIRGRGRLKFVTTNQFDIEYINRKSFWLDCRILLETVAKVSRLDGAF